MLWPTDLVNVDSWKRLKALRVDRDDPLGWDQAAFAPDGKSVIAASEMRVTNGTGFVVAALNAAGDRLAVSDGRSRFVGIWDRDGKRVATLATASRGTFWLGFAGEANLWIAEGPELGLRDIATGKELRRVSIALGASRAKQALPALSPNRKWLVVPTGTELTVYAAADGSRAGAIPLPAGGWELAHLAMHPSGRRFAAGLIKGADLLVAVWDLTTGAVIDQQVYQNMTLQLGTDRLRWIGDRQVQCGQVAVDLDLRLFLGEVVEPPGPWYTGSGVAPSSGVAPDSRNWVVRQFTAEERGQLKDESPAAPGGYLAACSIPEAVLAQIAAARKGTLWHPGAPVRVHLTSPAPAPQRAALAAGFADLLAREGFRVDPKAPLTLQLTVEMKERHAGRGKRVAEKNLTAEQKMEIRGSFGKTGYFEITDEYDVVTTARLHNAQGKVAFTTETVLKSNVARGVGKDEAWRELTRQPLNLPLPRVFLSDANQQRLYLPRRWTFAVAGVLPGRVTEAPRQDLEGQNLP